MTTKKCSRCKKEKTLEFFSKNKKTKDGLQGYCKACQSETQEIRYLDPKFVKRHRELVLKSAKIYNQTPHRKTAGKIRKKNRYIIKNIKTVSNEVVKRHVGCDKNIFIASYEEHFKANPGMTWDNYEVWHNDHITELTRFTLDSEESIRKANYYTNLRPMWATPNMKRAQYRRK
tara:strand:- start:1601 stop:2122 length:522 start_codon:yes stop_codon:yes gene_type:complete